MTKIAVPSRLSNLATLSDVVRYFSLFIGNCVDAINGRLSFADNIDCQIVGATFSVINTDTTVNHNLNRIATGYIVASASASMGIYTGTAAWTNSTIVLKTDALGNANLVVF